MSAATSPFDLKNFLSQGVEGSMDTKYVAIPPGQYNAICTKWDARVTNKRDGGTLMSIDFYWDLDAKELEEVTGRDKNSVRQDIIIDTLPNGALDLGKGKNVKLGQLREKFKMNSASGRWSPEQIVGKAAKVLVDNRTGDDGQIFSFVKSVEPF